MKNKKIWIAVVALVVIAALLVGIFLATRPATNPGAKEVTVTVVYEDGSSKDFHYATDAEYLGALLQEEGLAEGEMADYGLYITAVDGISAVWETDGAYWSLLIGGEYATTGADQIVLEDGGQYSLVYTLG